MSGVPDADGEGARVSPPVSDGRAGRRPPGRRPPARTAAGVSGPGLWTADLPRARSRTAGAPSASHGAACLADNAGGAGVMRPGGRTPRRPAGRARFPQYRTAPSATPAAAAAGGPPSDRRGRFRPAPPPPLRHDHHGCRDRPTRRGPARPREGHPGVLAARTSWCRGRVLRRLRHLRRGHPPCPARRGAGQRPMAPLEKLLRQSPARGPRAHRLLGHHQPAPAEYASGPPENAGTKSTTSSARASACSNVPAAWAWP